MDQAYAIVTDSGGSPLVRYLQQDARGNVTGVIRGTNLAQYTQYTVWGGVDIQSINAMPDTNRLGWQGLMHTSDSTPFYYVRHRLYDTQTGRFLNEDPLGIAGGMNLYTFAGDDPVNGRDPMGETYYKASCHINGPHFMAWTYSWGTITNEVCTDQVLATPVTGAYFGCRLLDIPVGFHCAVESVQGSSLELFELLTLPITTIYPSLSNVPGASLIKIDDVSCCRFRGHHIRWTRRNRRWGWARDDDTVGSTSRRRCS